MYQKSTYFGKKDLKKFQSKSKLTFDEKRERKAVMENVAPTVKKELRSLLKEAGLRINSTVSTGISLSITTKAAKGVDMEKTLDMIDGFLETKYGKKTFEINPLKTKGVESGYSISFSYEKAVELFSGNAGEASDQEEKTKKSPKVKKISREIGAKRTRKMKKLKPTLVERMKPLLKESGLGVNVVQANGVGINFNTRLNKGVEGKDAFGLIGISLNKEFEKDCVPNIKALTKDNDSNITGISISFLYDQVRKLSKGKTKELPVVAGNKKTNNGLSREKTKKRVEEMKPLIPALKEKMYPILKECSGGTINNTSSSGVAVTVITRAFRNEPIGMITTVSRGLKEVFGDDSFIIKSLVKKSETIGYSIKIPYEKMIEFFSEGKITPAKSEPAVKKIKKAVDGDLVEWAKDVIVSALSIATVQELLNEMQLREKTASKTLEKFISLCSTDSLINELEQRVSKLSPQEKLKMIQLLSK